VAKAGHVHVNGTDLALGRSLDVDAVFTAI